MSECGIKNILEYAGPTKVNTGQSNSPKVWETPPPNMFKLNFERAAKGNPGPTELGGVFRNAAGEILGVYWGFIGENTNNVVELKALLAGLNMEVTNG